VKRLFVIALAAAASFALVHADFADAARMGGGRSFGMQRSIAPPAARTAPSTGNAVAGPAERPVMPATPGATAARPAVPPLPVPLRGLRAGSGRSRAWPRASASPRCFRIWGCPRAWAACF
jgi:hypothetical protein